VICVNGAAVQRGSRGRRSTKATQRDDSTWRVTDACGDERPGRVDDDRPEPGASSVSRCFSTFTILCGPTCRRDADCSSRRSRDEQPGQLSHVAPFANVRVTVSYLLPNFTCSCTQRQLCARHACTYNFLMCHDVDGWPRSDARSIVFRYFRLR